MSLKSNAFSCNELKDKLSSKKQLNNLWKQFMCSYGYQKYYNYSKDSNNNSTINIIDNNSIDLAIKSFLDFLEENSISIIKDKNSYNYNLTSDIKKGINILSEAKIWIMFIIYIIHNDKNGKNPFLVIDLFQEAIKNGCDIISLFEFFLIYISTLKENTFDINFTMEKIKDIMPKEFIALYYEKKDILNNIFQNEENNDLNMRNSLDKFLSNDIMYSHSTVFSSNKKNNINIPDNKKEKFNLEIKDVIIISKDYLNKGYFAIFINKKNSKENEINVLNPFMNELNLDFEEDDEEYCLMPLLNKYKNYEQKMDANKVLILINKSIYRNYTYYPHDENFVNNL